MPTTSFFTFALTISLMKGIVTAEIGIGLVEEMPISAIPLFVANPQVLMNQERNFNTATRLDDEETGEGSIELMPMNSIKVRFNPPIERKRPNMSDSERVCEDVCRLPGLPVGMRRAARVCNTELVHEFTLLSQVSTREDLEDDRKLDTTQRKVCGSKCVLQRLNLLQGNSLPDADKVTGYLSRSFGFTWTQALRSANQMCASSVLKVTSRELSYEEIELRTCQIASEFMKCIHETLLEECPDNQKSQKCRRKKMQNENSEKHQKS